MDHILKRFSGNYKGTNPIIDEPAIFKENQELLKKRKLAKKDEI